MRGHNTLLWRPRPRISRILSLHKTLGDRIKAVTPHTTRTLTQKLSCKLNLQAPKLSLALIALANKLSLALVAPA